MKVYYAIDSLRQIWIDAGIKDILISYLACRNSRALTNLKGKWPDLNIFLDSGAFTAFTRGTKINIREYANFIKENKPLIKTYAGLDVIGNWEATARNLDIMEGLGTRPLPTFHLGSPEAELRRLCLKYDYFALGGLVPISKQKNKMTKWLDYCFNIIGEYWPKKIHGFGINAFWAWERYPFYSVDATSWAKWAGFRRWIDFNPKTLRLDVHHKNDKTELGFKASKNYYAFIRQENIKSYNKACKFITKLWEARGVSFPE